jgi:hypothetical protein
MTDRDPLEGLIGIIGIVFEAALRELGWEVRKKAA